MKSQIRRKALDALQITENLLRGRKRRIVRPLNDRLALSIKGRFRAQKRAVLATIEPLMRPHFAESDRPVPAGVLAAAAAALKVRRSITALAPVVAKAHAAGVAYTAGELAAELPEALAAYGRTALALETELDATTGERIAAAIARVFGEDGLTLESALKLVGKAFEDRMEQASTIAEYEVSQAFHDGQRDAAHAVSGDTGDDVLKLWETEDDPCDDCAACEDEGEVELDFIYPAFGVEDCPGHPHCRCSMSYRRAGE